MQQVIRAFIAIELPGEIRGKLNDIQNKAQVQIGAAFKKAVRWVPCENIHLTIKFLGDVPTANLSAIQKILSSEASHHPPFFLNIGGIGAFPNMRRPRVIWAGCETPPVLADLHKAIDAETHKLGYPSDDRPFSAHLTLGRISQSATPEEVGGVSQALGKMSVESLGTFRVDRFHLFQSDLRPSGAVYTSLNIFHLSTSERPQTYLDQG